MELSLDTGMVAGFLRTLGREDGPNKAPQRSCQRNVRAKVELPWKSAKISTLYLSAATRAPP
jgi:hypothetical protein